jgi:hypothetical protein
MNLLKIVSVNVWFNKKKQISAIQFIYSDDKNFFVGGKSAKNDQEE